MRKNKVVFGVIGLLLIFIFSIVGFRFISKSKEKVNFYCNIVEVRDNSIMVKGIAENDVNHRGNFILHIGDSTKIINLDEERVKLKELKLGELIEVIYDGQVAESEPAQIFNVYKISILS